MESSQKDRRGSKFVPGLLQRWDIYMIPVLLSPVPEILVWSPAPWQRSPRAPAVPVPGYADHSSRHRRPRLAKLTVPQTAAPHSMRTGATAPSCSTALRGQVHSRHSRPVEHWASARTQRS